MGLKSWDDEPLRPVIGRMLSELDPARMVAEAITHGGGRIMVKGLVSDGWDYEAVFDTGEGSIALVAVGKAAPSMMKGALDVLSRPGTRLGPMICLHPWSVDRGLKSPNVEYIQGDHPLPGPSTGPNVRALTDLVSDLHRDDVLLILLSGGASSLTFSPIEGVEASTKYELVRRLLLAGANIEELNTVRRALSSTKGGGLLRSFKGRICLTIALSDVMSDDVRFVGSGLGYPWKVNPLPLKAVLERYVDDREMIAHLTALAQKGMSDMTFHGIGTIKNVLVGNNGTAVSALSAELRGRGLSVIEAKDRYIGDASAAARYLLDRARMETSTNGCDAFIMGGEATVKVRGNGRGGRCSEMALSVLEHMTEGEVAAFLSTDGVDGAWDGGGAIIRKDEVPHDVIRGHLERNDSGGFFDRFGGKVSCGPTGNNLGDLFLFIRPNSRFG